MDAYSVLALSNNIREPRFKCGEMTQRELAELVGVSRQTINAIERNKHATTIGVALRIAAELRASAEDVFTCEGCDEGDSDSLDELTIVVYWDDDDP